MLITRAKNTSIESFLEGLGHLLQRVGGELVGPCPVCGGRDRFAVNTRRQIWNCRQCAKGGDVIDLVQHVYNLSVAEAIKHLTGEQARPARMAPIAPTPKISNIDDERQRREAAAHRVWQESIAIAGTPGEAYFEGRGIPLGDVPGYGGLRWHPYCPWENGTAPCVVARFTDAITGEARGIWRRPINGGKPKSLGPMRGAVIRLWPDEDVTTGLVIGEGVETMLAFATRFACPRGTTLFRPAWAAASAGNLEDFPVLPGIGTLTIAADNDANGRGQEAAKQCAARWAKAGREVFIRMPNKIGCDFNDMVMRK